MRDKLTSVESTSRLAISRVAGGRTGGGRANKYAFQPRSPGDSPKCVEEMTELRSFVYT